MFSNTKTFSELTRTAQEAATSIGCELGAICKSIVFRSGDEAVVVLTSGSNKVDLKKVEILLGKPLQKADAEFVREKTGFVIGGVPPWGHTIKNTTLLDEDLAQHAVIWAAAGTPFSVFPTTFAELKEKTGALVGDVRMG